MPLRLGSRPLKRWRYVGVYTPELMLCVGDARIGPVPQRWWAIATPDGALRERTTFGRGGVELDGSAVRVRANDVIIDFRIEEHEGVEVVSPVEESGGYIWTRKQACLLVRGTVELGGRRHEVDGPVGFVDDSAGYHARHTEWRWSAGIGTLDDGLLVGWNLVSGVHDAASSSERTLWVEHDPVSVAPVRFATDLSEVAFTDGGALHFYEWSAREHSTNAWLLRSSYRQPFGTFTGELPGGRRLAEGFGVMEHHDALW
jgi:hypothetical protein